MAPAVPAKYPVCALPAATLKGTDYVITLVTVKCSTTYDELPQLLETRVHARLGRTQWTALDLGNLRQFETLVKLQDNRFPLLEGQSRERFFH
jgi:hypothetical protein